MADLTAESIRLGRSASAAADRHRNSVQKAWEDEVKSAKAYVKVVLANNPGAAGRVFDRPDVQFILQQAALQGFQRVNPMVDKAALAGSLLGSKVDGRRNSSFKANGILTSLHGDLERIAAEFPSGIGDIIIQHGDDDGMDAAFRRFSLRVQMVAEAAAKMHFSLAMIDTMRGTDTLKMWQTTSDKPCKFCTHLEGQKREWDEPFDVGNFPVYGKKLFGPQLHPNCRCLLVIVPKPKKKV